MMTAGEDQDADKEKTNLLHSAKQAPESMDFEEMETVMWRKV